MAKGDGRGGKRTPTEGKKLGRPKATRPTDGNLARKLKAKVDAEKLWLFCAQKAIEKAKNTGNTADIVKILMYWDDRDMGRPVDTVNHMHDKPLDVNVTHSVSERLRLAMEKAEKRLADAK